MATRPFPLRTPILFALSALIAMDGVALGTGDTIHISADQGGCWDSVIPWPDWHQWSYRNTRTM